VDAQELAQRRALIAHALEMNASGLNQGTAGNLSLRHAQDGTAGLLITPSGVRYDQLAPEDIVFVRLADGGWQHPLPPSSEWRFHRDIYLARPELNAVVHAHPTYCTALAMCRREIPAVHYMIAAAGGSSIRCAPYFTYGTAELSAAAVAALQGRLACLLANHGLIACGTDLERALWLALEVEALARQYHVALQFGQPVVLPDDEIARVVEKFKSYGLRRKPA
jgi:L-fuculose-phosphate aldolase